MFARLWWKDARQFWPIWVLLAVVSLAARGYSCTMSARGDATASGPSRHSDGPSVRVRLGSGGFRGRA